MGATASSSSQGWKKKWYAVAVAARKNAAQATGTAMRIQRRLPTLGQTAAEKKIAMGASSTTSHRHGNCRKRSFGSKFQIAKETGSCRKSTASGMSARGTQRR